jgi:hypothetical protein
MQKVKSTNTTILKQNLTIPTIYKFLKYLQFQKRLIKTVRKTLASRANKNRLQLIAKRRHLASKRNMRHQLTNSLALSLS